MLFANRDFSFKEGSNSDLNIGQVKFNPAISNKKEKKTPVAYAGLSILQGNVLDAAKKDTCEYVINLFNFYFLSSKKLPKDSLLKKLIALMDIIIVLCIMLSLKIILKPLVI